MPRGVLASMPITARRPARNGPSPLTSPSATETAWPSGKSEVRISASVMRGLPELGQQGVELRRGHGRDRGRVVGPEPGPDLRAVAAIAEALDPRFEAGLLRLQGREVEGRRAADQPERRRPEG